MVSVIISTLYISTKFSFLWLVGSLIFFGGYQISWHTLKLNVLLKLKN
jgi:hypothetical protein